MGMRALALVLFAVATVARSGSANACTYINKEDLYFNVDSSEFTHPKAVTSTLERLKQRIGALPSKCVSFSLSVAAETGEKTSDGRLRLERAEAVKKRLVEVGFSPGQVHMGSFAVVQPPTYPPGTGFLPERKVTVEHRFARGRLRCDPATEHGPNEPRTTCSGRFGACYLELADGTACNVYNVPEPNPQRYSVASDELGGWIDKDGKPLPPASR
jgi:hypothetical protein